MRFGHAVGNTATATAPTAGAAVVTLAAANLPRGTYLVEVLIGLDGTIAAAERNNMQLQRAAGVILPLLVMVTVGIAQVVFRGLINVDGAQTLSVNAVANATASSQYYATITAHPVIP